MNFLEALSAFLLSGIKLLFTPMGYAAVNVFPLLEIALICAAGGIFGSVIFYFVGKGLDKLGEKIIQYAELECNSPDVRGLKN